MDGFEGEISPQEYARLSSLMYLPQTERDEAVAKLGYRIDSQDEDRALFTKGGKSVIAFRGTDIKSLKRGWRDVLTDVAMVFGQGEKTPRFRANEAFVIGAIQRGHKDLTLTGHSLGGAGAVALGREFGTKTVAFNPAFGAPAVAKSIVHRVIERRKLPQLEIHTTWTDPVSFGVMGSLTGRVVRHKKKFGLPSHAIEQFT